MFHADHTLIQSIKDAFHNAEWWELMQDEVKEKINEEIDFITISGPSFRDAFVAFFTYEHNKRLRNGQAVSSKKHGVFGSMLSDECYKSATAPTHALLGLDDWTKPNDADVQACIYLCQQVESFESQPDIKGLKSEPKKILPWKK